MADPPPTTKMYSDSPTVGELWGRNSAGTFNPRGMAASGRWLAVGGHSNKFDLFYDSGGIWIWKQSFANADGGFGRALAMHVIGDEGTLLVGAYGYNSNSGRVYVYTLSGGVWSQQGSPFAPAGVAVGDYFGWGLTVDHGRNEAFVSSVQKNGTYADQGYIYRWTRSGSTWTEGLNYTASDVNAVNWYLGIDMQMVDGHMLVGSNAGKCYYWADDSGWAEKQIWTKSTYYGAAVALQRPGANYFVIGYENRLGKGAALTYTRSGFTLTERDELHRGDGASQTLGCSVDMDPDGNVIAGGPAYNFNQGGACWWERQDETNWGDVNDHEQKGWHGPDSEYDYFGGTVQCTLYQLLIAEPYNDDQGSNAGCVYAEATGEEYPGLIDPVITPVNPYNGEEDVSKDEPIIFNVTDEEDDLDQQSIKAWVRGNLVFKWGWTDPNWTVSMLAIANGYQVTMTPHRLSYYRDEEVVGVRAYAEDTTANSDDKAWTFTAAKPHTLRIYPMLFDGTRRVDESS